jgi:hypothetical protein
MSLRLRFLLVLGTCIGFALSSYSQEVHLTDTSPAGSPLALSGTVIFADDGSQSTPYSLEIRASAQNVSSKSVLLLKVSVEILTNGASAVEPDEYTNDYYFSSDLLAPDSVVQIPFPNPHYGPRVRDKDSLFSAKARVEFVQFEDGTTWGDGKRVKEAFRARQLTLYELNVLRDAYSKSGDEGFSIELMRTPLMLPALTELQNTYKKNGVKKAEAMAWNMINAAGRHGRVVNLVSKHGETGCDIGEGPQSVVDTNYGLKSEIGALTCHDLLQ